MYDDTRSLFFDDLLPSYREFQSALADAPHGRSRCLRAAARAAAALFHFREHLPDTFKPEKHEVAAACPDYLLVEDITNVSKHGELSRGRPQLTRATDLKDFVHLIIFEDTEGTYQHRVLEVRAILSSGDSVDIGFPLTRVLNYWGGFLVQKGVLSSFEAKSEPLPVKDLFVSRRDAIPLDLESNHGGRFGGFSMLILQHDPCLGGNYHPGARAAVVSGQTCDPESGQVFQVSFAVTKEELQQAQSLVTPDEQHAFLELLSQTRSPVSQEKIGENN